MVPTYLPSTRYGGPIYSVHGLCVALVKLGHEVHVFTTSVDGDTDSDVPTRQPVVLDGVQVRYFRSRCFRRMFYAPDMVEELKRQMVGFDLVHTHSVFLWPTYVAAKLARKNHVPYVLAPRGMLDHDLIKKKSRLAKMAAICFYERKNIEQAALIHVTSELEGRELGKLNFKLPTVTCIPNGINIEQHNFDFEAERSHSPGEPYVLFLSRINWKKGIERLIRAWKDVPGAKLVIAGNDESDYVVELKLLAKEEGVESLVEFTGPVKGEKKWSLLKNASVFVLPSYSENFGIVVLEAMAVGRPVVVTPQVGLAAIVNETGCGLVVEGTPKDIAAAVNKLLESPELRYKMGDLGREAAREKFNWESIAINMIKAYEKIVNDPRISLQRVLK